MDKNLKAGESLTHFMEASIRESDIVLIICTSRYAEKANGRIGGVGYETGVVTGELFNAVTSSRFVPVLRHGSRRDSVPTYLRDRVAIDLRIEERFEEGVTEILELLGIKPAAEAEAVAQAEPPAEVGPTPQTDAVRAHVPDLETAKLNRILDDPKPSVVEFWAPWCGPCRVLAPVIEEIAAEYSRSTNFARINIDEEQSLAAEHEILSIPTVMVFEGREPKKKVVGAMPKRRLLTELNPHIGEPDSDEDEEVAVEDTVALTWHEGRIKAVLMSPDGTYSYAATDASRLGLVYLPNFVKTGFAAAVAELEELVNDPYTTKADIRGFLEAHPDLILGGEYKAAHPQVLLRRPGTRPLRPDFVLEPIAGELADIIEVETGQRDIASQIDGVTELTDVVMEACARLREYRDHFEEERNRVEIQDAHGLQVFRPRMFVVIGRAGQTDSVTQRRLEAQLPDITLRSWDDVLAVARTKLDLE